MKRLLLIFAVCGTCLAVQSGVGQIPAGQGPVGGNSRVPVSSYQNGLRRSPNPVNLNGNDVITGNVSGGKEFRGFVPYSAASDIEAPVATDSFNTFMRQTAPIDYGVRQPYLPQPYYVPTKTVTSLRRGGQSGLITYAPIRTTGGTGDFAAPTYVKPVEYIGAKDLSNTFSMPEYQYTLSRPLSYTSPADLEKIVNFGLASQQGQAELEAALARINAEEQQTKKTEDTKKAKTEETIKTEEALNEDRTLTAPEPVDPAKRSFEPQEPAKPGQTPDEAKMEDKNKSLYEQMLELTGKPVYQPELQEKKKETKEANEPEQGEEESRKSQLTEIDKETAEALKDVHKTFATKAKTRFNFYMKAAEEYLKSGQYYRAADSYTLASIYNPSDPFAYAGRSHALFASGEYMSSSYYLMRAMKMFPLYAEVKVDLNAMIPDKDRLQSRLDDIKKWIDKTKSPELEFLLAYLYNQLGKEQQAVEMIDSAAEKLPDNIAVNALKDAIEKK
jgi:tetratricopeptide (TPR) repeat protein